LTSVIGLTALPNLREFEDTWEKHLDTRRRLGEITESTYDLYAKASRDFFARMIELNVGKMDELTPSAVDEYLVWRLESIKAKGGSGRGVVTISKILVQIFELGIRDGLLKTSPLKHKYRPDTDPKAPDPFTDSEVQKMENSADGIDRLAFLLLKWTGLRKSDASSVTWSAINWEKETLTWETKKRHKQVIVPLHASLMAELKKYRDDSDVQILPMAQNRLYQLVVNLGKKSGVENCHPHRFRAWFVCRLLAKGASLFDVSKMIGDSHQVVEKYYSAITDGQQERVRGILAA
jgi:integrase